MLSFFSKIKGELFSNNLLAIFAPTKDNNTMTTTILFGAIMGYSLGSCSRAVGMIFSSLWFAAW
jgi:hypothetical protein